MTPTRKKKAKRKAARTRAGSRPRASKAKATKRHPRATRRRPAAKSAKRRAARGKARPARTRSRTAPKPRRTAVRRSARRATTTTAPRRPRSRPTLRVVRAPRAVRAAAPARARSTSFPQRAGASAKQLLMFEMIRARAAVLSAVQGLTAASANEPMGEGRWSVRETLLHLITRDQARLRESESTRRGQAASWKGIEDPAMGVLNAELMAPLRHLDWEDALRTLHRVREQLMEEIESVPEEPADVWSPEHAFGWMLHALPTHDRHHADSIKRWRLERTL